MSAGRPDQGLVSRALDVLERYAPERAEQVVHRLRGSDVFIYAGGLAFYALISLIPFFIVGFWLAGAVAGEDRIEDTASTVSQIAPADVDIESFVTSLLETSTGIGFLAVLAAIWPATAYGGGLVRALEALAPGEPPGAHGLRGRARALVTLFLLPLFILGGVAGASLVSAPTEMGPVFAVVLGVAAFALGVLITWLGIIGLYWWFGNADLNLRSRVVGGGSAALAIGVMTLGYFVYMQVGTNWEERTVGSGLAAMVLLGLWLYLSNLLLLTGWVIGITTEHGGPPSDG